MTKSIDYPLLENCRDILSHLQNSKSEKDAKTYAAAAYIVKSLGNNATTTVI
jgi:hypothetical protein